MTAQGRSVTLLAVVAATACGPGPLDPSSTGGELVPGTAGAAYLGGHPFSVSPDHRWLVFLRDDPGERGSEMDLADLELARLRAYVLYDIEQGTATTLGVSEEADQLVRSTGGPLFDGGCWIGTEGGLRVALRDPFGRFLAFDPTPRDPSWTVATVDEAVYAEACPPVDPHRPPAEPVGPFRLEGSGSRAVRIIDATDAEVVYATHRAGLLSTQVQLSHVHLSPDGRRLAYVVTPSLGSFVSNARAFVIDADDPAGSPTPLASPVYAIRWAPEGSVLYAAVRSDGDMAIYRWTLDG